MDSLVPENNLSSSLQTTIAVGGALALVAGAVIHRNKGKLTSLLEENLVDQESNTGIDWQNLTIRAQVSVSEQPSMRHSSVLVVVSGSGMQRSARSCLTRHTTAVRRRQVRVRWTNLQDILRWLPHRQGHCTQAR